MFEQPVRVGGRLVLQRFVAQVQVDAQMAAIAQTPARAHRAGSQYAGVQRMGTG
ncbi:hypothetical protein D3C86_1943760 [compost metagenome]